MYEDAYLLTKAGQLKVVGHKHEDLSISRADAAQGLLIHVLEKKKVSHTLQDQ